MRVLSFIKRQLSKCPYRFRIEFPCREEHIDKYYDILSKDLFGPDMIPTREFLKAVPTVNRYGLIIIVDDKQNVEGGIELYGFKSDFFNEYINGEKTDHDFDKKDLLTETEIVRDGRLYCAITIPEFKTAEGRPDTARIRELRDHLLIGTAEAIRKAYFSKPRECDRLDIYALAASNGGKALLKSIEFREFMKDTRRKDEKPLYRRFLHKDDVKAVLRGVLHRKPDHPSRANAKHLEIIERSVGT